MSWKTMTSTTSALQHLDRPADRIRLHLQAPGSRALIVEGPTDQNLLEPHLSNTDIFPVGGRSNVLETLRETKAAQVSNCVGVIDPDFDGIPDDVADLLLPYEGRDLEGMLVSLGVLATVLQNFGSRDKIECTGGVQAAHNTIIDIARTLSVVRQESAKRGWGLNFADVKLDRYIDRQTLAVRWQNYSQALVQQSSSPQATPADVQNTLKRSLNDSLGPCGKDCAAVTAIALRQIYGSHKQKLEADIIIRAMHSSAAYHLSNSDWLRNLKIRIGVG